MVNQTEKSMFRDFAAQEMQSSEAIRDFVYSIAPIGWAYKRENGGHKIASCALSKLDEHGIVQFWLGKELPPMLNEEEIEIMRKNSSCKTLIAWFDRNKIDNINEELRSNKNEPYEKIFVYREEIKE